MRKSRLEEWLNVNPTSITAQIANAFYYVELGWFVRGGGYAHEVSRDFWKIFKENVEIARKKLMALDKNTKKDVGWYTAMLEVALSQGWSQSRFDNLFNEAIERYPSYIPLYFYKNAYMKPKWHGSQQKFIAFVDDVVEKTKNHLGHQMYARLHWSGSRPNLFESGRTDWLKMRKGFEQLIKNHPDEWNINNFAKFSCLAGDVNTLNKLLTKIGNKPIIKAWYGSIEFYDRCSQYSSKTFSKANSE